MDNASQVIMLLGKCINSFNDEAAFASAWDEFCACHCPYRDERLAKKQQHFTVSRTRVVHIILCCQCIFHAENFMCTRVLTTSPIKRTAVGSPSAAVNGSRIISRFCYQIL